MEKEEEMEKQTQEIKGDEKGKVRNDGQNVDRKQSQEKQKLKVAEWRES